MTLDAQEPLTATPRRVRLAPLLPPGVLLAVVYAVLGTWSVGQAFGGYGADDGWVDFDGNPTSAAPLTVDVVGHPALWVFAGIAGILLATAIWASRAEGVRARRRSGIGVAAAAAFVLAVVLVFTFLQMHLVQDAFAKGEPSPPVLGNVSVTVGRLSPP